jgi:hypothetical protein
MILRYWQDFLYIERFGLVASGPWKLHSHLTQALKAAKKAGFDVAEIAVNANGFKLISRNGDEPSNDNDAPNEWDEVFHAPDKKRSA